MSSTPRIRLDQDGPRSSYFRSSNAPGFRSAALLLAVIAALASAGAAAQTAPPSLADQQEQRERAEREARERAERQAVPDPGQPSAPAVDRTSTYLHTDLPSETPCFRIDALRLQGDGIERFDWIQRYLNQYAGKCIGQEGIGLIVRRASDLALTRGYVTTRIGLPEQNLAAGTLNLLLVPGTIRAIRFQSEGERDSQWRSAFPARPGDLLNLRELEQGLEQLKRVPSQDATMDIVPGDKPGESDVVITLKRQKLWRGALSLDDAGSRATGRSQVGATVWLDNLANINDLLSAGYSHDATDDDGLGSRGYNGSYSIPWGNWRFAVSGSGYRYHQTVIGATQRFGTSGRSQSADIAIERLLSRAQSYRTSLELRVGQRRARSYVEGVELENQRRQTTSAELALLHRQYWGRAQLDLRLAHRRGLRWLGGQDDLAGRPDDAPTFRYGVTSADIGVSMPFALGKKTAFWSGALRYQHSGDPLYASEFVTIGGRYTVQGFDGENSLGGRSGGYLRNSVSLSLSRAFAPYLGFDVGHIESDRALGIEGGTLSGAYLGVRGDFGSPASSLSWDAFAGWPLSGPRELTREGRAAGFRLAWQF